MGSSVARVRKVISRSRDVDYIGDRDDCGDDNDA